MKKKAKPPIQVRNCEGCGEPMEALRSDKRFHSDKCRKHYNKYIKPFLSHSETTLSLSLPNQLKRNSEEKAAKIRIQKLLEQDDFIRQQEQRSVELLIKYVIQRIFGGK